MKRKDRDGEKPRFECLYCKHISSSKYEHKNHICRSGE